MTYRKSKMTIGIPTYGRNDVLVQTLNNILTLADNDIEVIVADQSATHSPGVKDQLQKWSEAGEIKWIKMQDPSLPGARNRILALAQSEIILFLDDDVIIPENLLHEHLRCYEYQSICAVAGQVFHHRDRASSPSLDAPTVGTGAHYPMSRQKGPIDTFVGCNHSVRRKVAVELGGYDENFIGPANGEDTDMAHRIASAGFKILYNPKTWVIHRRVPAGGCRIPGSRLWPEWTKTANFFLFIFRYKRFTSGFWNDLRTVLRAGPLRKENVIHPLRWPGAWCGFVGGMWYGFTHRNSIRSSFLENNQ